MRYKMKIEDSSGNVVWECPYNDAGEMLKDCMVLMKPSVFGTPSFHIMIENSKPE